jgi:septal ring factor EnvC (AmiA/AmiB activator)
MSAAGTSSGWLSAFVALLGAGGFAWVLNLVREWRQGQPKQVTVAKANLDVVSMARDELVEDNARLRTELVEKEQRHAAERAQWLADQQRLRADIARLEEELRSERAASVKREREAQQREREAQRRYDALLERVRHLGVRTDEQEEGR